MLNNRHYLLRNAVGAWHPGNFDAATNQLRNVGRAQATTVGGMQLGSNSTPGNAASPVRVLSAGRRGVHCQTTTTTTPTVSVASATGLLIADCDFAVHLRIGGFAAGTSQLSRQTSGAGTRAWVFSLSNQSVIVTDYLDGTNASYLNAEVIGNLGTLLPSGGWVRIQRLTSGGKRVYKGFTAPGTADNTLPATWTLASTVNNLDAATLFESTSPIEYLISDPVHKMFAYRIVNYSGDMTAGGTKLIDVDFTTATQTTVTNTGSHGGAVTLPRTTSAAYKTVVLDGTVSAVLLADGVDDYGEVADHDLLDAGTGQAFTVATLQRAWATLATASVLIAKKNATNNELAGYQLRRGAVTATDTLFGLSDGTNVPVQVVTYTAGALNLHAGVRGGGRVRVYVGSTTLDVNDTAGDLSNEMQLRLFRFSHTGSGYNAAECAGAAIWRYPLTANELLRAQAEFQMAGRGVAA
jgi:hypothetical protein